MFTEFSQPGYLHVLLNHLPIVGSVLGTIALGIALALCQRAARVPALAILFIAGISAWPVYVTGEAAYRPIHKLADEAGVEWLDEHMDRADQTIGLFYGLAGLSLAALVLPSRWSRIVQVLTVLTLLAGIVCSVAGAYIAQPGGRIRHVEFRPAIAPE